jgi:transcriptional regulator with XRE-family HTH domain
MKRGAPPNNLRVLRAERGLRQQDVSAAASLSLTRYNLIENGRYEPRRAEAEAIAEAFNVSTRRLGFKTVIEQAVSA